MPSPLNGDLLAVWRQLRQDQVFVRLETPAKAESERPVQPLFPDLLRALYGHSQLLPIESLKLDANFWQQRFGPQTARLFLSSGTTRSQQSVSPFTAEGLELYRQFSLKAFWAMLGHFFPQPASVPGWSLVPPCEQWPDSSLAQMLAWIAAEAQVVYAPTPPPQVLGKPLWLFATAFHLVQFADSGQVCPLPAGSVVIETGGTKGQSRSVSRSELYALIERCFAVPAARIVSEYGMCEMASQAYDFVPETMDRGLPLTARRFRFPAWVTPQIVDGLGQTHAAGEGSLLVDDPLRIDLPWPLRTEDMVDLRTDGSFRLLGRVPYAPLKGCSLLAEEWIERDASPLALSAAPPWQTPPPATLRERATRAHDLWRNYLADPQLLALFQRELGSQLLAEALLADLEQSLPPSAQAWVDAALMALGPATPGRWLIIPPRTHAVAPMQALGLAAVLGLSISLRCSSGAAIFELWQQHFRQLLTIELLGSDFRLGRDPWPAVDAALVFGSSETVEALRNICPWPVQGFGSHLTASCVHANELTHLALQLWQDALSLGQKGCMSSRLAFVWGAAAALPEAQREALETAALHFCDALSLPDSLSLVHASYQWQRQGRQVHARRHPRQPLLIIEAWSAHQSLAALLCDRPWTLPVLMVRQEDTAALGRWIQAQPDLQRLSLSPRSRAAFAGLTSSESALGASNAPPWTGLHQGRPLFFVAT